MPISPTNTVSLQTSSHKHLVRNLECNSKESEILKMGGQFNSRPVVQTPGTPNNALANQVTFSGIIDEDSSFLFHQCSDNSSVNELQQAISARSIQGLEVNPFLVVTGNNDLSDNPELEKSVLNKLRQNNCIFGTKVEHVMSLAAMLAGTFRDNQGKLRFDFPENQNPEAMGKAGYFLFYSYETGGYVPIAQCYFGDHHEPHYFSLPSEPPTPDEVHRARDFCMASNPEFREANNISHLLQVYNEKGEDITDDYTFFRILENSNCNHLYLVVKNNKLNSQDIIAFLEDNYTIDEIIELDLKSEISVLGKEYINSLINKKDIFKFHNNFQETKQKLEKFLKSIEYNDDATEECKNAINNIKKTSSLNNDFCSAICDLSELLGNLDLLYNFSIKRKDNEIIKLSDEDTKSNAESIKEKIKLLMDQDIPIDDLSLTVEEKDEEPDTEIKKNLENLVRHLVFGYGLLTIKYDYSTEQKNPNPNQKNATSKRQHSHETDSPTNTDESGKPANKKIKLGLTTDANTEPKTTNKLKDPKLSIILSSEQKNILDELITECNSLNAEMLKLITKAKNIFCDEIPNCNFSITCGKS